MTNECPLPDTICTACLDSVDNFYSFIRNCLQNIIVLEAQYEIIESCLKTKRQVNRSVTVDPCDLLLAAAPPCILPKAEPSSLKLEVPPREEHLNEEVTALVDYECSSSTDESDIDEDIVRNPLQIPYKSPLRTVSPPLTFAPPPPPFLFDAAPKLKQEKLPAKVEKPFQNIGSSDIITEIVQRKYLKRKNVQDSVVAAPVAKQPRLETAPPPSDSSSRRKSSRPKRVEYHLESKEEEEQRPPAAPQPLLVREEPSATVVIPMLPTSGIHEPTQTCLLCEQPLPNLLALAKHLYQTHAIDFANACGPSFPSVAPQLPCSSKARRIPELVKISDVLPPKRCHTTPQKLLHAEEKRPSSPAAHSELLHYNHHHQQQQLFVCSECPVSPAAAGRQQQRSFSSFADFSAHRRAQHQIFHCDLCSKFYGRNSHLWKHVNRVHKGHEAITCSECGKTSASEYHLAQHRNKMHSAHQQNASAHSKQHRKPAAAQKAQPQQSPPRAEPAAAAATTTGTLSAITNHNEDSVLSNEHGADSDAVAEGADDDDDEDNLLTQKFQGFDFKSVRQSFLRQELLMNKRQRYVSVLKRNNCLMAEGGAEADPNKKSPETNKKLLVDPTTATTTTTSLPAAPKEIDSSSDLYTTIITNYTPPSNEGPYKCPKCFKGFHKKNLLKKHKKNCRPRLQKDLLTRCKTCSRIFKDRQSLAKHLVNYHSEYTCEICAVAVQSKCEIVSHIRFTHPGSELQCHCGQILRSWADLARHKAEHRDSHVCQFCGDALPTKIKLKMHILSLHRKILALSCGICLRLFESQHVLRAHVRHAHADQLRPLTSCTVCGKNYGSKWKTYDHLNKSHGRIFRACKVCLDVFDSERDLQLHTESQHQNNNPQTATQPLLAPPPPQTTTTTTTTTTVVTLHNNNQKKPTIPKKNVLTIAEVYTDEEASDNEEESSNDDEEAAAGVLKRNGMPQSINRLSLLEKRLMGKKSSPPPPSQLQYDSDASSIKKETASEVSEAGTAAASGSSADDILQNSSKRTVYVNSNDPSLCEICLKVWPAKKHLWQHYIRCHKQTAATVCGICLKTNPSYSALQRHLRDTHPRLLHGCGFGSNFICKICGRYHNASSKLRLHMAIHVGYNGNTGLEHQEVDEEVDAEEEDDDDDQPQVPDHKQQTVVTSNSNSSQVVAKNKLLAEEENGHTEENDDEEEEDADEEEDEEEEVEDGVTQQLITTIKEEQSDDDESNEAANSEEDEDDDEDESMAQSSDSSAAEEEPPVQQQTENDVNVKQEADEGFINYESLIEEVEATDDEEDESADSEDEMVAQTAAAQSDQENFEGTEGDDDDDDDEDEAEEHAVVKIEREEEVRVANNTENELEREMLKNMIGESRSVRLSRFPHEPPIHLKTEMKEEMADEEMEVVEEDVVSSYEIELLHEEYIKTEAFVNDNWDEEGEECRQQQHRQPGDELDSAIRSICDEDLIEEEVVDAEGGGGVPSDTYRRLIVSGGRVNESELETAVGSIL